jgi:hypothetical protein
VITPVVLPWPLHTSLETATRALFDSGDRSSIDFLRPAGEAALVSPDSVSWRVFKNPLSLFIGGVTAVIMELAEPRVRTGVWEHTTFRLDPIDCAGDCRDDPRPNPYDNKLMSPLRLISLFGKPRECRLSLLGVFTYALKGGRKAR